MRLSELLAGLVNKPVLNDVQILGVSENSADVEKGDVFIALSGFNYCQEAIDNGAVAIVYAPDSQQRKVPQDFAVPMIECCNLSQYIDEIVERFYGNVTKQIKTIAITGTDGKSSVAHLVTQALDNSGDACGMIGTLGYGRLQELSESTHTTPPRARLAKEYDKFKQIGCDIVALEASSHGIHQNRLSNLYIHTAVLTNITRDHLDYHKTIEAYIQTKAALFFDHKAKYAVINLDDDIGQKWRDELCDSLDVVSYSLNNKHADIHASHIEYLPASTALKLSIKGSEIDVHTTLLGEFNVMNLLAVASVLVCLQKTNEQITLALNKLDAVPGRMQSVHTDKEITVIVDYAHTPAALFSALKAVRKHCNGKLICVFGCGGDRDQGKRSHMGEVATQYSDYVVITSDNPRTEQPELIIQQIIRGCESKHNYISIVDRRDAIAHALHMAAKDDAVLIAGKGHEKYQCIGDQAIAFDDVEVVKSELQRMAYD